MVAIDTNIFIRFLVNDDENQAKIALKIIENNSVFISKTVLLESEWVLRYAYKLDRQTILSAFEKLLGLPQISVEDPTCISQAMEWYSNKIDFADALHLASSKNITNKFATLDKSFVKQAKKLRINLLSY